MTIQTLLPAARTYGWRTWHDAARESAIALLIGLLASLFTVHGAARSIAAVLGIVLAARGLETALSWAIEQSRMPTFFRCVIYVLAGGIACFVAAGARFDFVDAGAVVLLSAVTVGFI